MKNEMTLQDICALLNVDNDNDKARIISTDNRDHAASLCLLLNECDSPYRYFFNETELAEE